MSLVATDAAGGASTVERARKSASLIAVEHAGARITFTISLSVAQLGPELGDHAAWLARSDEALYASKEIGRDHTTVFAAVAT